MLAVAKAVPDSFSRDMKYYLWLFYCANRKASSHRDIGLSDQQLTALVAFVASCRFLPIPAQAMDLLDRARFKRRKKPDNVGGPCKRWGGGIRRSVQLMLLLHSSSSEKFLILEARPNAAHLSIAFQGGRESKKNRQKRPNASFSGNKRGMPKAVLECATAMRH